jgi:hypothetical protein
MITILLSCRFYTVLRLCSVYGRHFNDWRTATFLRRCLHDWRIRSRSLLPNMGDSKIVGLRLLWHNWLFTLLQVLFCNVFLWYCASLDGCVYLSFAQNLWPDVLLKLWVTKLHLLKNIGGRASILTTKLIKHETWMQLSEESPHDTRGWYAYVALYTCCGRS